MAGTTDLPDRLRTLSPTALQALRDELATRVQQRRYNLWTPYPWQTCPGEVPAMGAFALMGGRGTGKRLHLGTMLPTPTGWITMGEVQVGTRLLDDQGQPCTVTWVSPDNYGDSYRVSFSDGSEILADAEHQWLTWDKAARKAANRWREDTTRRGPRRRINKPRSGPKVRTTAEIAKTLRHGNERNHSVRNVLPLDLPEEDLPIAPYTLGLWLGDGRSQTGSVTVGYGDESSLDEVRLDGYEVYQMRAYTDRAPQYRIKGLHKTLRIEGLIDNKHVPMPYLRASQKQRVALLQGLMDSDGYMSRSGQAEFVSTNERLAEAVHELVVSLGMSARRSSKIPRLNGVEHRRAHLVRFTPIMPVFRLSRKLESWREDAAQAMRRVHRYIDRVERIPSVPMRCIAVDSPSRLYLAGRDMIPTHNTDAGARYVLDHINGPPCDRRIPGGHRIAIIAPTLGDAAEACVNGPSGLKTHDPRVRMVTNQGGTHVHFANGSQGKLFGAHSTQDVDRLRAGGNRCLVWMEEAAAMRYLDEAVTHSKMGLRIGRRPHYVVTTTPKPRKFIVDLAASPKTLLTKGKTRDAYHLPPEQRVALMEEYGGTTLGKQELDGEILTEVKGALVSRADMDRSRVPAAPELNMVVVGFDPNGTGTGDESGIVACGRGAADGETYVLADASTKLTGRAAALRAWALHGELGADVLVYEDNLGKSWLAQVLSDAWYDHKGWVRGAPDADPPPMKPVHAGVGKALRAQPTAMRFEQGRAHIVGTLDELETQLATWVPLESPDSPDRIDALVHAEAYLRGRERGRARVGLPHTLGALR